MKRHFLHQQSAQGEGDSEPNRNPHTDKPDVEGDQPQPQTDHQQDVPENFKRRPKPLKHRHKGKGEPPNGAALRMAAQFKMAGKTVTESALPADALIPERAIVFRHFGPADRIRHIGNPIGEIIDPIMVMEAHHQLHIFADRGRTIPSDF